MIRVGRFISFTNLHILIAFGGTRIPGSQFLRVILWEQKSSLKRSGRRHLLNDVCKCGDCWWYFKRKHMWMWNSSRRWSQNHQSFLSFTNMYYFFYKYYFCHLTLTWTGTRKSWSKICRFNIKVMFTIGGKTCKCETGADGVKTIKLYCQLTFTWTGTKNSLTK